MSEKNILDHIADIKRRAQVVDRIAAEIGRSHTEGPVFSSFHTQNAIARNIPPPTLVPALLQELISMQSHVETIMCICDILEPELENMLTYRQALEMAVNENAGIKLSLFAEKRRLESLSCSLSDVIKEKISNELELDDAKKAIKELKKEAKRASKTKKVTTGSEGPQVKRPVDLETSGSRHKNKRRRRDEAELAAVVNVSEDPKPNSNRLHEKPGGKFDHEALIGRNVLKKFEDGKYYGGTVIAYKKPYFKIEYIDGDREDVDWKELEEILVARRG